MKFFPRIIGLGTLMALLLPTISALAGGNHGGGGHQPIPSPIASPPSEGLIAAWGALTATCGALAEDVEAGRLGSVHQKAGTLPELAQALMLQADALNDSKRKRVKSGVIQLTKVAEHLKTISDAGSEAALKGDLKRIDRALRLINSQYPEGSLPLSTHSAAGHAGDHHH